MRYLSIILLLLAGCTTSRPSHQGEEARVLATRIEEIKRQAPLLGIPVDDALAGSVRRVRICQETGRNNDGSYVCDSDCAQIPDCVHAWCLTSRGSRSVEYMFATPDLKKWTIAHEVHHELIVRFYGIGGHPRKSEITRLTDGKKATVVHAEIIKGRWPSLVNWALPESAEVGLEWATDFKCGSEEVFVDGSGI